MPGIASSSSPALLLGQPQATLASREQCLRDLLEVRSDGVERLREPPLDRLVELVPELRELLETLFQVLSLRLQVGEVLLLALVLLGRERVDPSELLAAAAKALDPVEDRLAVVALGRLRAGGLEPAERLAALGFEAGELDIDCARPRRDLGRVAPDLRLGGSEPSELVGELSGARGTRVGPGAKRRLRAAGDAGGGRERRVEPLGHGDQPPERGVVDDRRARLIGHHSGLTLQLGDLIAQRTAPRLELEQDGLGSFAGEPQLSPLGVVGDPVRSSPTASLRQAARPLRRSRRRRAPACR